MLKHLARFFNLQVFNINGTGGNSFPAAIINVIEQKNFLQTEIRKALFPTLVFRPRSIKPDDWFQARVGETKTFTRDGLIAPNPTPLSPSSNTGQDNGMTADQRAYEQWTATLNEWPGFIPTNILGQEAMIADLFVNNMTAMGQKAGSSLELVCMQRLWTAYDSGDTFVNTATTSVGATNLSVDNINGFNTQYLASNSPLYAPPVAVSNANTIAIVVIDASTKLIKYVGSVQLASADSGNVSCMQTGGFAFGVSGQLTTSSALGTAINKGDRVVALDPAAASSANPPTVGQPLNPVYKDGPTVVRPVDSGVPVGTAYGLAATDIMQPSVMIPYAVSILKRRGVPKLPNGLYGCAIDSTLLASFYGDTGFQRATATNWDRGRYFSDGVIAAGWGVEFTEATQVPVYASPGSGSFSLRHGAVFGLDVISEHPFVGARDASDIVAGVGDVADERWVDRIKFRSMAALDTLGQVLKFAYDYVGDFQAGTDKASNPSIVFTSDYARYKRMVMLQCAAAF